MRILTMAWRNLWRNWRRSGITVAAMTLALIVELLYSGLVTGMVSGMEDDVTEIELGDLQIIKQGYFSKPSLYETVSDHERILAELEEAGYAAAPRLFSGGLAASGEASSGVAFVGLDPVRDARTLALSSAVGEGEWLSPDQDDGSNDDPLGVVIGKGLSRTLGAGLGDEIVVLSQAADGSMANELFHVRGILKSVAAGMDRGTILMPESTFRALMVLPDGAHKIIVRRPAGVALDEAKRAVQEIVGIEIDEAGNPIVPPATEPPAEPSNDVMTWTEINPFLAQMLDSVSGVVVVVYFIVYVAVGILILNAMLMAVFERIREFGVLKAIGYGPFAVLAMMLAEGMMQAFIATVIGLALAAPAMWYLAVYGIDVGVLGGVQMGGMRMPAIWRGDYSVETVQVPIIMLFVIVFVAVLYPALKAAWIRPVDAMTHQ